MLARDSVLSFASPQGTWANTTGFLEFLGGVTPINFPLERHEARPTEFAVAAVAQLAERVLGKDEVMGSTPISSFVFQTAWVARDLSDDNLNRQP
jgi:hypothetical protein